MLYKSIFLKAKTQIEKKLIQIQDFDKKQAYLEFELKDEILKSEEEIKKAFEKVKCAQCGACCSLAISEFSPCELSLRAKNGDKTAKSFLEVFEPYESPGDVPLSLLPDALKNTAKNNEAFFYHCKKIQKKDGKSFCPIYDKRPDVCKNFPDTPLENLPKACVYNVWKDENEVKAMFIKALNDIRKFYLSEFKKGE